MRLQRRRPNEGAFLALFVFALTVLLAFVGMVVDGGYIYLTNQKSQAAADAAAMAAAYHSITDRLTTTTALTPIAQSTATLNQMAGVPSTVTLSRLVATKSSATVTAVSKCTYHPFFLQILGVTSVGISNTATATASKPTRQVYYTNEYYLTIYARDNLMVSDLLKEMLSIDPSYSQAHLVVFIDPSYNAFFCCHAYLVNGIIIPVLDPRQVPPGYRVINYTNWTAVPCGDVVQGALYEDKVTVKHVRTVPAVYRLTE